MDAEKFMSRLMAGDGIGIGIEDGNSSHAITCWGFSFDNSLNIHEPGYITGLYISDSDDSKYVENPDNVIKYIKISWNEEYKSYRLDNYESLYYYFWRGSFVALPRMDSIEIKDLLVNEVVNIAIDASNIISAGYWQSIDAGGVVSEQQIHSGGYQSVSSGGKTINTFVFSGGRQTVFSGGVASRTILKTGGIQYVSEGGKSISGTISGGILFVLSGGDAINTYISFGGIEKVTDGAMDTGANVAGQLLIYEGGKSVHSVVSNGGFHVVFSGGNASDAMVASGGSSFVSKGGLFSGGAVIGTQTVCNGGIAENVALTQGGAQILLAGGKASNCSADTNGVQHLSGGMAITTHVKAKGAQRVSASGSALETVVSSGGSQIVFSGGSASGARILSGGVQNVAGSVQGTAVSSGGRINVRSGGVASAASILAGGTAVVAGGGVLRTVAVAGTGALTAKSGAMISAVTLKSGAKLNIAGGNTLYGAHSFAGATVAGGTASSCVKLAKNASIAAGARTIMSAFHLNASSAGLSFTGAGTTLGSLKLNSATTVAYSVSSLKAKGSTLMLSLSTKNSQKTGSFSVTVAKNQGTGVYELSNNLLQSSGTAYAIKLGSVALGTAELNGAPLKKWGMAYSVASSGTQISLEASVYGANGNMRRGTDSADALAGNSNSDVFYGGKGGDTITGVNGRDVAVYDKTAWGKDVIKATSGTMTILFKDLAKADVEQTLSGATMTITRKNVAGQSVTIQGWSKDTHNVVFGGAMVAFDTWLKAAAPTSTQTKTARNEAWKKAGLAQA